MEEKIINSRKDEAIKGDLSCPEDYIKKAEELMDLFDMEEAEKYVKKYLKLVPDDPRAYTDLMNIYYETGDFDNSLIYCNKLLEKEKENPELYAKKAFLLSCLSEEADEALECYDKAIELKPDFYEAICDKGKLLSECACHKEALNAYKQAILVAPDKAEAYMGAAFAYKSLGDIKKSIEFSTKAHKLDPDDDFYTIHSSIMREI